MRLTLLLLFLINFNLLAQKPEGTLPVELVYFQGYFADAKVILFWGTATEVNNYGFEVQRRMPQQEWSYAGFVFGSGNSNSPKSYYMEDSTDLQPSIYYYRLKQIDNDGQFEYSDTVEISTITKLEDEKLSPFTFLLEQNYPNPFNPATVISYQLSAFSDVTLKIYDVLGNEVAILVHEEQKPGHYEVIFNAQLSTNRQPLTSGVYFYRLQAGSFSNTNKFLLLK